MNLYVAKINRKQLLRCLIVGIFAAAGMLVSLKISTKFLNPTSLEGSNSFIWFWTNMQRSMSANRFLQMALAIFLTVLFYGAHQIKSSKRERLCAICFAVLFSLMQMIGMSYVKTASWDMLFGSTIAFVRFLWKWSAYVITIYEILRVLFWYFHDKKIGIPQIEEGTFSRKKILNVAVILFVCWLPYFFIFYPGTGNIDTDVQIMQFFQMPTYVQSMSPVQGADIFFTSHHPFILTLLFGGFVKLGLTLFQSAASGVAMYVICHMGFTSIVFATGIQYLEHVGVSQSRRVITRRILMFLPIFPLYAICMVKDTIFAAFCLLFMLMMFEVVRTKGEVFHSKKFNILMFLNGFMIMLTKNQGIYIIFLIGIIYLIFYRRYFKQILVIFFVSVLLFKVGYTDIFLTAMNVAPGGVQEALSVPFQQTARYVSEYPDEVTDEEKEAISAILPYEDLASKYDPELSDPVKRHFNQESTSEDLKAYFKVWFQMFFKHPGVYVQATLNNTYQYFYLSHTSKMEYYEFDPYISEHDENQTHPELYITNLKCFDTAREFIKQVVLALGKLPIVNLIFTIGILPWMILFCFIMYIVRHRSQYLTALLIPILTICVCIVSPDNGNFRYVMPLVYTIPFLLNLMII